MKSLFKTIRNIFRKKPQRYLFRYEGREEIDKIIATIREAKLITVTTDYFPLLVQIIKDVYDTEVGLGGQKVLLQKLKDISHKIIWGHTTSANNQLLIFMDNLNYYWK